MGKDLVFLLLLTFACAKKTVIEKSEGIFILNEKNYDKAVKEFDYLLVYFYAPWLVIATPTLIIIITIMALIDRCGHCKALGPEFVKAGQLLKERDSLIKLGKVCKSQSTTIVTVINIILLSQPTHSL